jgi:hypothetical protein
MMTNALNLEKEENDSAKMIAVAGYEQIESNNSNKLN